MKRRRQSNRTTRDDWASHVASLIDANHSEEAILNIQSKLTDLLQKTAEKLDDLKSAKAAELEEALQTAEALKQQAKNDARAKGVSYQGTDQFNCGRADCNHTMSSIKFNMDEKHEFAETCAHCNVLFCIECVGYCGAKSCKNMLCWDCGDDYSCNSNCYGGCDSNSSLCKDCDKNGDGMCETCDEDVECCSGCGNRTDDVATCSLNGEIVCNECVEVCGFCGDRFCTACAGFEACEACNSRGCRKCLREIDVYTGILNCNQCIESAGRWKR